MFKITSTQAVTWPSFALRKGENVFPSRAAVPTELWPKLERFRSLKLLEFMDAKEGEADTIVLAELTERQLFDMPKADLAELAKANGLGLSEGAKKDELLKALVAKLPKPPAPVEEAPAALSAPELAAKGGVVTDPAGSGRTVTPNRRGGSSSAEG